MKKKLLIVSAIFTLTIIIAVLSSCPNPAQNSTPIKPDTKTKIVFDNKQGICAISVYSDSRRRTQDKIADINPGKLSGEIAWTPGDSVFYFTYLISLKGNSGFTLSYVPELGKDQKTQRINANTSTTIMVPRLDEAISSPDQLLSASTYLIIQNNSSFSFTLLPDPSGSPRVNAGEQAQYTINPGPASVYRLLVGADEKALSGAPVTFEPGHVYSFVYNGAAVSLVAETEAKLANVVTPSNVPQTPGAPTVIPSDGFLTLSWTAITGAENYEVYYNTVQTPPAQAGKTVPGTVTVVNGLVNKKTYYLWIKAINQAGSSAYSPVIKAIPWPANEIPAVPGTPIIIPGINQLSINWDECGGAASYEVYINTSAVKPALPEITTDKTSAIIGNLENSKIYYIWVRAVNSAGKSNYSPFEAGTPQIPTVPPAAPAKPILTEGSRNLIVSWQAADLAAAYEVWLGTTNNSALAQKQGADITSGTTQTVITGLLNETTYYVWVRAKNLAGTSGFSLSASGKPSAYIVLPETPAAAAVIPGYKSLDISWLPAEGALTYELWTGISNNPANAAKYGADLNSTSLTLTGLINETTYYLWVKAKNNIGTSDFGPMAAGTPSVFAAAPSAPQTAPAVIVGSGQLTLSWQQTEGASVYEVWTGTTANSAAAAKWGGDVSGLSTVVTGLTNGITYYVWIKAKNSTGTSSFSPAASGTPQIYAIPPQAPAAPAVSIGNSQIVINWTAVQGAASYEIWLGTTNNSAAASKYGGDISASLSAAINGLNNGTMYYIWLKAKNNYGASSFSPAANGKPIANATAPNLTAGNIQISVSWIAIAGADNYAIYCGTGINPPETPTLIINAPATSTTITTLNGAALTNGTSYNVWIMGENSSGSGAMSSPASVKPIGYMGAVTVNAGNQQLSLSWAPVAGADQYDVYYSTSNTIPGSPVQTVSATTAVINGLTNGTTYYVWIKPRNVNGTGNVSSTASAKPLGTPGAPVISPGYGQFTVTWTTVAGADQYEVYYGIGAPTTLFTTTSGTSATITGLTTGTTYYVRLRAKNIYGVSDYGPTMSGMPSERDPGLYRGAVKIGNQNLSASLAWISANAVNGDEYTILLGTDEVILSPVFLDYSINYYSQTVGITLMGYGSERSITMLNSSGCMFTVNGGATLTIDENITLIGRSSTDNSSLIRVNYGTLIIKEGVIIKGNTNRYSSGGGIYIQGGTAIMYGGTIMNNTASYGGAVSLAGGTFTMYAGTIKGNSTSSQGGSVYVTANGIFTMYGGVISGNNDYGVYVNTGSGGKFQKLFLNNDNQNSGIIYGSEAVGNDLDGVPYKNSWGAIYGARSTTLWETDQFKLP